MSELGKQLEDAAQSTVVTMAQVMIGRAVKNAPVDEGTLRDSALATTVSDGTTTTAVLSFNTPYAAVQHEGGWKTGPMAGTSIKNHPKGGGSKYLERAVKDLTPKYVALLQKRVDEVTRQWASKL